MRVIVVLLAIAGLLMGIGPLQAADKPLVGVSLSVPEGGGATDLIAAVLTARTAGARLMYVSVKWSDLEPKPGVYNLKPIDDAVVNLGPLGFHVAITIQTIDTSNRTLPPDLMDKPFDSPEMRARLDALLQQIGPKLTAAVVDVNLGNEVDVYLGTHPQELEAYAGLMEAGRTRLRTSRPGLPVGVTTTFDGLKTRASVFQRLNRDMDVVTMTYYPLTAAFAVRPAADVSGDFDMMASAAGTKPLLLQEVGCPADPLVGSSEEKQAAFVDAVFDALGKHSSQIGFVNFFLMYDFGDKLVTALTQYYGLNDAHFRAFLGTLGLRKADGTPRLAWLRFEVRSSAWAIQKP